MMGRRACDPKEKRSELEAEKQQKCEDGGTSLGYLLSPQDHSDRGTSGV